jgi:very-short-patch-repair endonuclease
MKNLPFNKSLRPLARELRRNSTLSEVLLWNELKNKKLSGLDFDRQKIIGNYIVDLYCPHLNLVVEIDGKSHDWKGRHDEIRHSYLTGLGLRVLHIDDKDVKRNMNGILKLLENLKSTIEYGEEPELDSMEWFQ